MGSDARQKSSLTVIVADQSPAMRRTCRKVLSAVMLDEPQVREASTLHAVRVLLREAAPGLVVASDALAGGDADMLVDAIRSTGFQGRIILIVRQDSQSLTEPESRSGDVELVARANVAEGLPALLDLGEYPPIIAGRSDASMDAAGQPNGCDEDIVPFRVEERRIIETAIRRFEGSIGKAARALEISPSTIYRKIQFWHADEHR